MGITGLTLPNFDVKISPSKKMRKNWAKVTIFPHPGFSLSLKTF